MPSGPSSVRPEFRAFKIHVLKNPDKAGNPLPPARGKFSMVVCHPLGNFKSGDFITKQYLLFFHLAGE
jgi:hypothetical protein